MRPLPGWSARGAGTTCAFSDDGLIWDTEKKVTGIAANGYHVPVVDLNIKYRKSLKYGDEANVICTFLDTQAAKIIFQYEIYNIADQQLCATAETTQVFINLKGELQLTFPPFFQSWKEKSGLL